jgi:hypothetical protein
MKGSNESLAATALHTGGCVCGALRYKTIGQPVVATICHCRFCQKRLASAFAVLATFPHESVEFTQGQPVECEHRSDESGRWLKMQFCARCGTTVAHTSQLRPGMRTIAATTFDELGWFNIDRHIWVQSKLPWVDIPAGVAVFEKGPPVPQAAK